METFPHCSSSCTRSQPGTLMQNSFFIEFYYRAPYHNFFWLFNPTRKGVAEYPWVPFLFIFTYDSQYLPTRAHMRTIPTNQSPRSDNTYQPEPTFGQYLPTRAHVRTIPTNQSPHADNTYQSEPTFGQYLPTRAHERTIPTNQSPRADNTYQSEPTCGQ